MKFFFLAIFEKAGLKIALSLIYNSCRQISGAHELRISALAASSLLILSISSDIVPARNSIPPTSAQGAPGSLLTSTSATG
jgi:hypothetical protein